MTVNSSQPDCEECEKDGTFVCIQGLIYGPCSYDDCYWYCDNYGECECDCHESMAATD